MLAMARFQKLTKNLPAPFEDLHGKSITYALDIDVGLTNFLRLKTVKIINS